VRAALLPALALAGLALAGCGGPTKADAANVATTWVKAIAHHEDAAACKLMSGAGVRRLARSYVPAATGQPCGDVVDGFRDALGPERLGDLDRGMQTDGPVRGGHVDVVPKARSLRYLLLVMRVEDGHWKLDGPPRSGIA
jgi:hypothetical protein